ncbi:MAG: serine/threonine-protein kinase [Polyangiales bacterium]
MPNERSDEGALVGENYRVRRLLAEGGMSVVFDADHIPTGRRVAIKALPADKRKHSEFLGRLDRELLLLRLAKGPGIVEVLDSGVCPTFGPYLVMELLSGRPLDGILAARHHLSIEETLTLLEPLALTIARLHDLNIVHRDLKPANFMIESSSSTERVVLLDFGVSALLDRDADAQAEVRSATSEKLTTRGELLGTIEYMSPEQIMAHHESVDARSDIFCFGVSMFEILTGEMPFGVDWVQRVDSMRQSAARTSLANLPAKLPSEIRELLTDMLSIDRHLRPLSMHHVHQVLKEAAARLPGAHMPAPLLKGLSGEPRVSKRLHQRAAYVAPIRLISGSKVIDGRTQDVSEGGLLLTSRLPMPAGERVVARFALPMDGRIVQVAAVVRWSRESHGLYAIGLKFTDPPETFVAEIKSYVDLMLDPEREADSFTLMGPRPSR